MDFMATVMDVLGLDRPASQQDWAFDGVSVLPILRGEEPEDRGIGWMYMKPDADAHYGYAYRYKNWKLAVGGVSCHADKASFNCSKPQLYDMSNDIAENHDLALSKPAILEAILANFSVWQASVLNSMANESQCTGPGPSPPPHVPFPKHPTASSDCTFTPGTRQQLADIALGHVASQEECCGACIATEGCSAGDFNSASAMRPAYNGMTTGGDCHLKAGNNPAAGSPSQTSCVPKQ